MKSFEPTKPNQTKMKIAKTVYPPEKLPKNQWWQYIYDQTVLVKFSNVIRRSNE